MGYTKPLRHIELDQKTVYIYKDRKGKRVESDDFELVSLMNFRLFFVGSYQKYFEVVK